MFSREARCLLLNVFYKYFIECRKLIFLSVRMLFICSSLKSNFDFVIISSENLMLMSAITLALQNRQVK